MNNLATTNIKLQPIASRRDLRQFIRVPEFIYENNPNWVPRLTLEQHLHLSNKNPFFGHARWQGWIATQNQQPVGRICAVVDNLYLKHHHQRVGFFGLLEAINEAEIFSSLLQQAGVWLREQGMETMQGPYNLSINQECGMLVDGFDSPPQIMMPYNLPYYPKHLESLGFRKAKDLLAFEIDENQPPPSAAVNLAKKAADQFLVRPLQKSDLHREFELLRSIFNDAWSDNWGFVPFTREEFQQLGSTLHYLIPEDFVQIAETEGEAVGMIVALPNFNELIHDFKGRLLPWNWLKLLWRWKAAYPDSGRVALMGIRKKYQNPMISAAIAYLLIERLRHSVLRKGIQRMELSWILEDNQRIQAVIKSLGGRCHKRYRIYQKMIAS